MEHEFRAQMLKMLSDQDKLEQANQQKRRMKELEHKK